MIDGLVRILVFQGLGVRGRAGCLVPRERSTHQWQVARAVHRLCPASWPRKHRGLTARPTRTRGQRRAKFWPLSSRAGWLYVMRNVASG